ncbi:MAG: cobalt ECF transporter T component CbiQ [Desulfuromonadales bacterium]|nr:cobalt ECF transporter T component CbiQ [Desulfuromonadales bacterium]
MSAEQIFSIRLEQNSHPLVAIDGRIKMLLLPFVLVVNLLAGGYRVSLLLSLTALGLTLLAGVPRRLLFRRMVVPTILAMVALLTQALWIHQGEVLLSLPLYLIDLTFHLDGVVRGVELALRIIAGMSVLLFFTLTTPLAEMLRGARFFWVPAILIELALLMYRYIFLLFEEGVRIRAAQRARLGFTDFRTSLRSVSTLGGMLILRSYDRAGQSYDAMRCRGYRGLLAEPPAHPLRRQDALFFCSAVLLLGLFSQLGS